MGRLRVDRLNARPRTLVDGAGRRLGRCYDATGAVARIVGLLGTPDLAPDEALHIARCRSVHTIGMRVGLDVAFLDENGVIVRLVRGLRPGRFAGARRARSVIEMRVGALTDVAVGDLIRIEGTGS